MYGRREKEESRRKEEEREREGERQTEWERHRQRGRGGKERHYSYPHLAARADGKINSNDLYQMRADGFQLRSTLAYDIGDEHSRRFLQSN
jgi:hypothetical protein